MIDTPTLRKLAAMGQASHLIAKGVPGGYILVLRSGLDEEALKAQRGGPRLFRKLEAVVNYLADMGISSFEVDSSSWDPDSLLNRRG